MSLDGMEAVCVKQECDSDGCGDNEAALAALYEDHEVKQELVLGPELLQPRDIDYTLQDQSVIKMEQSAETINYQADLIKKEGELGKHTSLNVITEFQESTSTQEDLSLKDELDEVQQNSPEQFVVNGSSGEAYLWTKVTKFKCNTCNKEFSVWTDVERHMNTHMDTEGVTHKAIKHFTCKTCGSKFDTKRLLLEHAKSQHGEKYFTCDKCEYATIYAQDLRKHLNNHAGEKSHKCSQCSYAFNKSYELRRHLRIHTGEKPYKCSQCSSAFHQRSDLRVHHRIHTGEKPFGCNICGYRTTQSSALKNHQMARHSGQKPFGCDACSYRSATRGPLKDHLKRIHKLTYD